MVDSSALVYDALSRAGIDGGDISPELESVLENGRSFFVSPKEIVGTFFSGILKGYRKAVLALEKESNPKFFEFNAVDSLAGSDVKALLIYSEDDTLCRKVHYDIMKEGLAGKENVRLMLVQGKGHNPNYTAQAVKLLGEFSAARAKLAKKKNATKEEKAAFVASFDWSAMTAQDESVWKEIFEHLDA